MGNVSFQVINEKDYQMVMSILKVFADNQIIRIIDEDDNDALPFQPLSDEELLEHIRKAEASPIVSGEEALAFFQALQK